MGTSRSSEKHIFSSLPKWLATPLLVLADLAILYLALIGAIKARTGDWAILPGEMEIAAPLLATIPIYMIALALSGIYQHTPRQMHLGAFLKSGGALIFAWTISVTVLFLLSREFIPPRSISAIHCLLSVVGVLGLRAILRQALEWRHPEAPVTPALQPIRLGNLVPRKPTNVNTAALRDYLSGRTVMVTGAGGSIGSELCEQLIALQPFRLLLVDVSEYNLFQLENRLRPKSFDGELEFTIADVRDESIMNGLFRNFQPDIVLHAAAYKHVPLMERHPVEAFRNNTLATVKLLQLSERYGAEQFVLVSTDKAVQPSSVLGATKRIAEWYVRAADSDLQRKTVRFGNVFGSQGSVAPQFEERIKNGKPLRVTHPEMTRYFMSADEACGLILQTLLMDCSPTYIFDMGDPVSIQDLAESIVKRYRPRATPDQWIEHCGIRPGEKLREELATETETPHKTNHDRILGLNGPVAHSRAELDLYLHHLRQLSRELESARLRRALFLEDFQSVLHQAED